MTPAARTWIAIAAVSGFFAVALGAFGAHVLQPRVDERLFDAYRTGVLYHFVHTLALIGSALLLDRVSLPMLRKACGLFLTGIVLFSGSLYVMAWTGLRWMGAITPVGGVAFLAGWLLIAIAMLRRFPSSQAT